MIRWRVGKIIKRFARNSEHVRFANFKRMRGLDREWKRLRGPAEHICRISHHFGPTGIWALTVYRRCCRRHLEAQGEYRRSKQYRRNFAIPFPYYATGWSD